MNHMPHMYSDTGLFKNNLALFCLMYMNVLPTCIYVSTPHEYLVLLEVRGQVRFFGTKVTDGDEPPCGFWESKPGPL